MTFAEYPITIFLFFPVFHYVILVLNKNSSSYPKHYHILSYFMHQCDICFAFTYINGFKVQGIVLIINKGTCYLGISLK